MALPKSRLLSFVSASLLLSQATAFAQKTPPSGEPGQGQQERPQPTALAVGALELAGAPSISLTATNIDIAIDKVVYSYGFKNAGAAPVELAGGIELPSLAPQEDGGDFVVLPRKSAENPVDLSVTAGDAPVATTPHIHANVLGVNHLKDVKAAELPILPFGPEIEAALAQLPLDSADKLAAQGLLSPRDPADPKQFRKAAWTLDVTRALTLDLPANTTTPVHISFAPVKAVYSLTREDAGELDGMKEDMCIPAKTLAMLRARLALGGQWQVTELSVDADPPNEWFDAPKVSVSVQKPRPDAIVVFCGANDKTASGNVVTGAPPEDSETNEMHIMIFAPADK